MRPVYGSIKIPGSKSLSHRALIAAALASGESVIDNLLLCEDTLFTANALKEIGARISFEGRSTRVFGTGARFPRISKEKEVFLGNSGTTYRFLLSAFALAQGEYLLTGSSRMNLRPVGDLITALRSLGVQAVYQGNEGFPPVLIRARGIPGGSVEITARVSSQYVSSLLLAGPYMEKGLELTVLGEQVSRPYIGATVGVMKEFGVDVERKSDFHYRVPPGQRYVSRNYSVEGDVSSASYFWAAAAVTGGTVTTENIAPFATLQGDIALLDILGQMGCTIVREGNRVTVHGKPLSGVQVDMGEMPDMVPTLAAIAPFAKGATVIRNVRHLRYKESDRLRSIATEWRRLGVRVEELEDGLIVPGTQRDLKGVQVDPHEDHRIAMSLAVISLMVPGLIIGDKDCVDKSFPGFWQLWQTWFGCRKRQTCKKRKDDPGKAKV
ncbi:MAG: 3-phosphoshikimate 1-carboxyvinyltransferase [Deltaproteobacteria bacterium]|nr:3-phosphoshikimate 1-carboxyvinyltransferase [Deltaproteobacteria bacterium]